MRVNKSHIEPSDIASATVVRRTSASSADNSNVHQNASWAALKRFHTQALSEEKSVVIGGLGMPAVGQGMLRRGGALHIMNSHTVYSISQSIVVTLSRNAGGPSVRVQVE